MRQLTDNTVAFEREACPLLTAVCRISFFPLKSSLIGAGFTGLRVFFLLQVPQLRGRASSAIEDQTWCFVLWGPLVIAEQMPRVALACV